MRSARLRPAMVVLALGATVWVLWRAGPALPLPSVGSWSEATRWYEAVGPSAAVMACVRAATLALAGWLLVAATLQLVAEVVGRASVRVLADVIAPGSLQRLMGAVAGVSLTVGLGVRVVQAPPPVAGSATMHLVPDPTPVAPPAVPVPVPAPAPVTEPVAPDVVVVARGDSLWSLAEEALIDTGHAAPDDAVVARYWRRLIEANRSVLVVPTNPDLIYPGQVVTLPPS